MRRSRQLIASAVVSLSLIANSTVAAAAAAPPPPSGDPWLMLSMLTPSGAAALGSTGVAAAQPAGPPPSPQQYTGPSTPPLPVILVWLAVLGADIYLLTKNNHTHPVPNSPA